jgi:hypothetical protein
MKLTANNERNRDVIIIHVEMTHALVQASDQVHDESIASMSAIVSRDLGHLFSNAILAAK